MLSSDTSNSYGVRQFGSNIIHLDVEPQEQMFTVIIIVGNYTEFSSDEFIFPPPQPGGGSSDWGLDDVVPLLMEAAKTLLLAAVKAIAGILQVYPLLFAAAGAPRRASPARGSSG